MVRVYCVVQLDLEPTIVILHGKVPPKQQPDYHIKASKQMITLVIDWKEESCWSSRCRIIKHGPSSPWTGRHWPIRFALTCFKLHFVSNQLRHSGLWDFQVWELRQNKPQKTSWSRARSQTRSNDCGWRCFRETKSHSKRVDMHLTWPHQPIYGPTSLPLCPREYCQSFGATPERTTSWT